MCNGTVGAWGSILSFYVTPLSPFTERRATRQSPINPWGGDHSYSPSYYTSCIVPFLSGPLLVGHRPDRARDALVWLDVVRCGGTARPGTIPLSSASSLDVGGYEVASSGSLAAVESPRRTYLYIFGVVSDPPVTSLTRVATPA